MARRLARSLSIARELAWARGVARQPGPARPISRSRLNLKTKRSQSLRALRNCCCPALYCEYDLIMAKGWGKKSNGMTTRSLCSLSSLRVAGKPASS